MLHFLVLFGCATSASCQQPDYQGYFIQRLGVIIPAFYPNPDSFVDAGHIHDACFAAASEVRAWQMTSDVTYANSAVQRLYAIANSGITDASFFAPYPLTYAYQQLNNAGLIPADLQASMQQFVSVAFRTAADYNHVYNQTLQRAAGLALAAQVWPGLAQAAGWSNFANQVYNSLAQLQDLTENAANYNDLDLAYIFVLGDVLNRPQLFALPGIRAMYDRFANQVSPVGFMAPYGDSGTAANPFDPNWPMTNPWGPYVAGFERAGREYQSTTLRWAAVNMAQMGMADENLGRLYPDIIDLFLLSLAVDWKDPVLGTSVPTSQSQILTRADFSNPLAADKLILSPSRQPNMPFLMSDLYVHGDHGHDNQHGSVTYFEYNNAQLLTTLGYNNRNPEQVSLLMMRPATDTFPHIQGEFVPNQWYQAFLPTSRLPVVDPAQPYLRRVDNLNMRIVDGANGVQLWALDFRLRGVSVPPIVLDTGQSTSGWSGHPSLSADAPPGFGGSLTWQLAPSTTSFLSKNFSQAFDYRQYPTLSFRWKLSNNDEQARPIIMRVTSIDTGSIHNLRDYDAWIVQLEPILQNPVVQQVGNDQYGSLNFSGWFTPDTNLVRQMVLTSSGILVVRDRLRPGTLADGMVGGPVWNLSPITPPTAGPNWFYTTGGPMDLLAYLEPIAGRTYSYQTTNVWAKNNQQTVFASQPLTAGQPLYFVSVLVPETPGTDPATAAAGISTQTAGTTSTIQVSTPRDTVTVQISDDGTWSVSRAGDFSISAAPGSMSVTAGSNTTYTVKVTASGGFNKSVALSASGLPPGATAAFNPASVTGSGTSTLTVSTTNATPAGNYSLTITGTSASAAALLTHSAGMR